MAQTLPLPSGPDDCPNRFEGGHLCARPEPHCDDHECDCGWRWPALEEVRILRLQPGDVVVCTPRRRLSSAEADEVFGQMRKAFPNHQVVVVDEADLSVMRADKTEATR